MKMGRVRTEVEGTGRDDTRRFRVEDNVSTDRNDTRT